MNVPLFLLLAILGITACSDPADRPSHAISRLTETAGGILHDTASGLAWARGDGGSDLGWTEADRRCRQLRLGGHSDWRLPRIEELQGLFDERFEPACGDQTCHLDPAIGLGARYVWSAAGPDPRRRFYFDFQAGSKLAPRIRPDLVRRALCVRDSPSD
jgi:hypothetical protein